MVGANILYHCTCTSIPSTSAGSSGPALVPPLPQYPSHSYAFHPLPNLYFCEECDAIRCNRCITIEVSGYYCPNCLFEVPSASVRAEKNRCARNCFQCPQCSNTLSVVSSDPPTNDLHILPGVNTVGEPPFFLYCSHCRWDSAEIGVTFDKPTGLALQLQKTEDNSYDTLEFDRLKEHFEPLMRNSHPHPAAGAHGQNQGTSRVLALNAINAAASSALARDVPGLRKKRVDSNVPKDEYGGFYKSHADCVSGREESIAEVEWLKNLTQEEFTLGEVASLQQRWTSSWTQSMRSSTLRPLRIPLHSKQTKRCPKCRHILIKPEQKSQSIRFKIKLMAANYVPSIDVMVKHPPPAVTSNTLSRATAAKAKQAVGGDDSGAGQPLQPGKTYGFQLSLTNPLYEPVQARVTVQKPPTKPGIKRPPYAVSLPSNPFPIGAFAEAWEYDDEEEDAEMDDDDIEDLLAGRESSPAPGRDDTSMTKGDGNVGILERKANVTKIGGEVIIGKESPNPLQFNLLVSYAYRAEEQIESSTSVAPSRPTGGETKTFSFYVSKFAAYGVLYDTATKCENRGLVARSMDTSSAVKARLGAALGTSGLPYWNALSSFLSGKMSRAEFDRVVRKWINTPELVMLHNALLMSMITVARADPTYDPTAASSSTMPARKRRRLLPHQEPPPRLRKWILGIRRFERERLLGTGLSVSTGGLPQWKDDEIAQERSVALRQEGKNPPFTRVPVQLSTSTRALPSQQNLLERVSLIASQHNLTTSRPVAVLATAAIEAYLKQLSMHALSLTTSSHPFASISPSNPFSHAPYHTSHSNSTTLKLSSILSLLTIVPSSLPTPSAAADRLFLRGAEFDPPDDTRRAAEAAIEMGEKMGLDEGLAQYWALLSSRSGVRDWLNSRS